MDHHSVPHYFGFKRVIVDAKKCGAAGTHFKSVAELLKEAVLSSGYSHEYISSEMHISNLILDVDIKPVSTQLNVQEVVGDLVEVVDGVMGKILQGDKRGLVHYVFYSTPTDNGENVAKYGFHHHVCLPSPYVMTSRVAFKIVQLLNMLRYRYPKTLGVDCGVKSPHIFDTLIYRDNQRVGGHPVRAPFQFKPDGSKQLLCIFRSDGLPLEDGIKIERLFAHGSNSDICTGKIIKDIENIKVVTDNEFMKDLENERVNGFVDTNCEKTAVKIVDVINKRTVLYNTAPTKRRANCQKLMRMLNNLWEYDGRLAFKRKLMSARSETNGRYDERHVNRIVGDSIIAFHEKTGECLVVLKSNVDSGVIPICPNRVHRSGTSGVKMAVIFAESMIKICFKITCFKASCQNVGFLSNCYMNMKGIFLTSKIQSAVKTFLSEINVSTTNVYTVRLEDDLAMEYGTNTLGCIDEDAEDEDKEEQTEKLANSNVERERVVTPPEFVSAPLRPYISSLNDVLYFYMFLEEEGIGAFRTTSNHLILVKKAISGGHIIFESKDSVLFLRGLKEIKWGQELIESPDILNLLEVVLVGKDGQRKGYWNKAVQVG